MPQVISNPDILVEAVKKLELTAELFEEQAGKPKYKGVLEIARPALRLLRKLPKFGHTLDNTYRAHGFGRVLEDLSHVMVGPLKQEIVDRLSDISKFVVYGKNHVLCQEGQPVDRFILIKSGWVRRVRGIPFSAADSGIAIGVAESIGVDFLGAGNCLGLEGTKGESSWKYNA